ncbi:MAG: enoyl-CoA hydratase-related protein [Nitrososphaerota archaeon]
MSGTEETVIARLKGSVLWITLNRPRVLNAFDESMGRALQNTLSEAGTNDMVRAVVLTGSGRAFSVGEDLATNRRQYESGERLNLERTLKEKYNPIISGIRNLPKPVIAAINGVVAGAGLGIALACDLRVASDKSSFHTAFIKVALAPDSGTAYWLVKIVGLTKATEYLFLADPLDARTALDTGLVNWVFPDQTFLDEVQRIADKIARGPTKALGLTKMALNKALYSDLQSMLDYEARLQQEAAETHDHREGVSAFFEKREPVFQGR